MRQFYGFPLAIVLWIYYGLTLGLKAGYWGFFAPEITAAVQLSATDVGLVAGVMLGASAIFMPMAGVLIDRVGVRNSMFFGLGIGALGMLATAVGEHLSHFILGALLIAASSSFSGVIPLQTLIIHWFQLYRARAMAIVFTASPIWGSASYALYEYLLRFFSWRETIAGLIIIFPLGALLTFFFVKNRPADIGQTADGIPDGDPRKGRAEKSGAASPDRRSDPAKEWTMRGALLSAPFALVTLATSVSMLPFLFFLTYGRLFMESVGIPTAVAVGAMMSLTLAGLFGRLVASLADIIDARILTLGALCCNLLGVFLILGTKVPFLIYTAVFFFGVSFGLAFLLAPLLLARYFGSELFSRVEGVRTAIVVGLNAALTPLFGMLIDHYGTYALALQLILAVNIISMLGLVASLVWPFLSRRRSSSQLFRRRIT